MATESNRPFGPPEPWIEPPLRFLYDLAMPNSNTLRPGATVDLVCLRFYYDKIHARRPPHGPSVIVRSGRSKVLPVEGEIFTLKVTKTWIFGHTQYASGTIHATRFDLEALELTPLGLTTYPPFAEDPFETDLPDPIVAEILRLGSREVCEMEQILPENAVELQWEEDPIVEAALLMDVGAFKEAKEIFGKLLSSDLRCLDAHAHLGNIEFSSPHPNALEWAKRHYQIGVAIGELTLGGSFDKLLPWGMIDNRPYLRCLAGLGLTEWRLGEIDKAREIFRRSMILNPPDNLGARFLWADIENGRSWEESCN